MVYMILKCNWVNIWRTYSVLSYNCILLYTLYFRTYTIIKGNKIAVRDRKLEKSQFVNEKMYTKVIYNFIKSNTGSSEWIMAGKREGGIRIIDEYFPSDWNHNTVQILYRTLCYKYFV